MVAFYEQRLDSKITRGALGGPTTIGRTKTYSATGQLRQNFLSTMPVHKYDVSHGVRSSADFDLVLAMFYVVMFTPYTGFRYKDWRDYQATQANTSLRLISGTNWQLQRKYTIGAVSFRRDITKPVDGTVSVHDATGVALTATVNPATGVANVTGTPVSWAGQFDVPVTFTDDEWMAELEVSTNNLHVVSQPIKLEELKPL